MKINLPALAISGEVASSVTVVALDVISSASFSVVSRSSIKLFGVSAIFFSGVRKRKCFLPMRISRPQISLLFSSLTAESASASLSYSMKANLV